jgi:hypothetical protein
MTDLLWYTLSIYQSIYVYGNAEQEIKTIQNSIPF